MIRVYAIAIIVSILIWVLTVVAATLIAVRLLDDEPCVWEDCARLMDLPSQPICYQLGDPGCLVVPD